MTTLRAKCTELARRELERRAAEAQLCRRSFADFAQVAIGRGVVDGIKRVQWGPHLETYCRSLQFQIEGWIVAAGPYRASEEWPAWAAQHAEMIERQRAAWERAYPVIVTDPDGAERTVMERPTWEDGAPEPWLRYVLAQNEIDNLPPGTLKSTLAMVLGNAWIWLWAPAFAFAALSGIESNVERDSKATRDLVRSRWYRETFEIVWTDVDLEDAATIAVKRDSDAVSDWATTAGGKRRSRTISTGLTGSHSDGIFCDDPDDADKVYSEAERVRVQNRWTRAGENRVNSEARSIRRVLQQRVHPLDFTAYLLSLSRWSPRNPRGWLWFCLPAEYGLQPADAPRELPWGLVDWRTEAGETLHGMLSPGVLATAKDRNPAGYEGQYNQNPERGGAGILARRHARFFVLDTERDRVASMRRRPDGGCPSREAHPPIVVRLAELTRRTLSVDANNTLDLKPNAKPSAVGLLVVGMRGSETFVLEDRTRVLDISDTYRAIYAAIRAWQLDEILVELKAAGGGVINELRVAIRRGWYMDPETDERINLLGPDGRPARPEIRTATPTASKAVRNQSLVQPWQDGLIFLRDGAPWLHAAADANRKTVDPGFIGEVCSWSKEGDRGDRLDALSQYVARHRQVLAPKANAPPIVLTRAARE